MTSSLRANQVTPVPHGIKDLVVGRMTDDTVDYYRNTTKKGLPVLERAQAFLINGELLVVPGIY